MWTWRCDCAEFNREEAAERLQCPTNCNHDRYWIPIHRKIETMPLL